MVKINLCEGDISVDFRKRIESNSKSIAFDIETTGLDPISDELCLVQLFDGKQIYVIKIIKNKIPVNLKKLLENKDINKIFHHVTTDLRFLYNNLKMNRIERCICTKISAKLINGIDGKNTLKDLLSMYMNIEIDKSQRMSDWTKNELTEEQIRYASNDVMYLIDLWEILKKNLSEKNLLEVAQKCFDFAPIQSDLINRGFENIFEY